MAISEKTLLRKKFIMEMLNSDDLTRAFRWLFLYILGICFVALVHTIQYKNKAWTLDRWNAWKRTVFFLIVSWSYVHLLLSPNLVWGRLYEHSSPIWKILLFEVFPFTLLEDALFYWSHRSLHSHPFLYRKIHSFHHQAHKDVSLVNGIQVTVMEYILSLVVPGTLPLLLVKMNRLAFEILSFIAVFGVIFDHGLDLFPSFLTPFPLNGTKHHLKHHERVKGNYSGPLAIWDYLMDTQIKSSSPTS